MSGSVRDYEKLAVDIIHAVGGKIILVRHQDVRLVFDWF